MFIVLTEVFDSAPDTVVSVINFDKVCEFRPPHSAEECPKGTKTIISFGFPDEVFTCVKESVDEIVSLLGKPID